MKNARTLLEPSVPTELRRDALHLRVFFNPDPRPYAVKVAPVPLPGIVFHKRGRGRAIRSIETPLGAATRLPLAFVYGAGTTPSTMRFHGGPHLTIQIILVDGQIQKLDHKTGEVLTSFPAPDNASRLAWAEDALWVGRYQGREIRKLNPSSGEVLQHLAMPKGMVVLGLESDGAEGVLFAARGRAPKCDSCAGRMVEVRRGENSW